MRTFNKYILGINSYSELSQFPELNGYLRYNMKQILARVRILDSLNTSSNCYPILQKKLEIILSRNHCTDTSKSLHSNSKESLQNHWAAIFKLY